MKTLTSFFTVTILMITLLSTSTYAATFEIQNNCSDTVWAAAVPGGGRKLTSGETWILNVANGTAEGRIWARTNCTFNANGRRSCQTGDCGGVLECKSYGSPPVTLAEYALNQHNNLDFLDISLIDGFNVPMTFSRPSDSCTGGISCSADINDQCPGELRAPGGCNNPCTVFKTDQYCCVSGGNCGPTNYSRFFKDRCPDAYSYPQDDPTSTFTCPGGSNYRVVFCPETFTFGAQTGVCYGRLGSNLPSPADAVALCNQNNIRNIRIYDPHQPTLQALRGSNIEVILGVPNTDLQNVAASQANANNWVQKNVRNYPNVRFRYIAVGNEVSPLRDTAQYKDFLLPAIRNVFKAISAAGLGNQIKVSTAVETGLVGNGFPPSAGTFLPQVQSFITPIVQFLARNGAPLLVNVYPYFAYIGNPRDISLEYALFTSSGIVTPDGVRYQNLFDALLDATYSALEKAGGSSVQIVVSESGWPTSGGQARSIDNARTYNNNLIRHANGNSGTPKRPGRAIETYIFALFDEDQKSPEYEKHFGLFLANGQPKYPFSV